jgi:uncharacterized protein (TIGR02466 family)
MRTPRGPRKTSRTAEAAITTKACRAWFPTYVYEAPLVRGGAGGLNREILEDVEKLRATDAAGQRWCRTNYPDGYTSYASHSKLHRTFSTFMDLEKKIARHVRAFARHLELDLDGRTLEMTDCWVNVMPRHAVHGLHLHPMATISGTYYVKTPRGCSRIRFEDPRLDKFMAAPPRLAGCRPDNRQQVAYDVEAGNLILFESWLRHEVVPNTVEAERVSVSFNYNWF